MLTDTSTNASARGEWLTALEWRAGQLGVSTGGILIADVHISSNIS